MLYNMLSSIECCKIYNYASVCYNQCSIMLKTVFDFSMYVFHILCSKVYHYVT